MKKILKNDAVQSLIASLLCIILGLLIGYIVLLFINPEGAWDAILAVLKNFMKTSNPGRRVKLLGATLVPCSRKSAASPPNISSSCPAWVPREAVCKRCAAMA